MNKSRIVYLFVLFGAIALFPPVLSAQIQYVQLHGRYFYEYTYGFADNRIKEQVDKFVNAQGQSVQTEINNTQIGALGFSFTYQFSSIWLLEMDMRYQNTALNGSDGYRVKYLEQNNTSEKIVKAGYAKANIGFGIGTPFQRVMLGALTGFNMEYGERIFSVDPEASYLSNNGIPQQVSLDSDLLIGFYGKLKLMVGISDDIFLCFTPSFQKSWKAVDVPTGNVQGFQTTKTTLKPAVESFDVIIGFAFATDF